MKLKHNALLQIIVGFFLADLIAGGFHWFEDNYIDYCIDIPIINEIAKDNEMHHYFPRSILANNYIELIEITLPLTMIVLVLLYFLDRRLFDYPYLMASFGFFSVISNILHAFSHMRNCETSDIMKFMQKCGILCSHEHHKIHHESPDQKYCVITEYNNYILDNLYFWRILEFVIYLITGIKPNRKMNQIHYNKILDHMHENAKLECPNKPTKQNIAKLKEKLKEFKNCKIK